MSTMMIHEWSNTKLNGWWHDAGMQWMQGARRAIWCLAALALLAPLASAQSTSRLNGSVSDPSGAAVPGAKITLSAAATGLERTTTSNGEGLYQFLDVPPGTYRLEATAKGFLTYVATDVILVVNTPSTIGIRFQLQGTATQVTIEGEAAPLINRTDATLGNVLEEDQISELPIADRNVVQLLSLQPGVAYLGNRAGRRHGHTQWRRERDAQRPVERYARRHRGQRSEQRFRVYQHSDSAAGLGAGIPGHDGRRQCRFRLFQRRASGAGDQERDEQFSRFGVRVQPQHSL